MNIQVYGQRELQERIENGDHIESHLVSIGNPGRFLRPREDTVTPYEFKSTFSSILRLEFYDVLKKEHLGNMRPKRIPQKRDVRQAIRFFYKTRDVATGYTVHCWRGISRSTAIALGYLYMIYGDEQKAVDELKRIQPEAGPHPGIVKYFDDLLSCNLSAKNEQLRELRFREMKEWFFNEIDDGDALIEELESADEI